MNLNNPEHPDLEALSGFIVQPDGAEYANVRNHLIQCDQCRHEIGKLSDIKDNMAYINSSSTTDSYSGQIEQYVDGVLQANELREVKQLLQQPQALKAALHYAVHSAAMSRELGQQHQAKAAPAAASEQTTADTNAGIGFIDRVVQALTFRPPLWAAGAFVLALAVVFIPTVQKPSGDLNIATYQDSGLIYFQQNERPGIGFFGDANKSSQPYGGMQVSIIGDAITLQWAAVDKVSQYKIQLQMVKDTNKTHVDEKTTTTNQVTFNNHQAQMGRRYEWILSGQTQDSKTFYTNGGFVINQ